MSTRTLSVVAALATHGRLTVRSGTTAAVLATAGLLALGAGTAQAGTATSAGGALAFSDPAGLPDDLEVSIHDFGAVSGGWATSFADFSRQPDVAAGCANENDLGPVVCRTGTPPPSVDVDVGGGNDRVALTTVPPLPGLRVTVHGGPGDDEISAFQTVATVYGGDGDDLLKPESVQFGAGPPQPSPGDVWSGGPGTDTVDYTAATVPIDVSLDDRANDGRKGERDNVRSDVENVIASPSGGTIIGSARANVLTGRGGPDRLVGGAGRDTLDGQGGNDTIDALDGRGGDRVQCGDGADVAYADAGDVVARDCEKVTWAPAPSSSTLRWRSQRISVRLTCPKTSKASCSGVLRLTTTKGKKLATTGYKIRRGKTTTVTLRVKKRPARQATLVIAPKGTAPTTGRAVTVR